ncbi:hypothetical protein BC940DRAFT_367325, partial [Gongronella butleri]
APRFDLGGCAAIIVSLFFLLFFYFSKNHTSAHPLCVVHLKHERCSVHTRKSRSPVVPR